jgi:hypothetical protein
MLLRGFREARRKLRDFIKAGEQDRLCIIREASEGDPEKKWPRLGESPPARLWTPHMASYADAPPLAAKHRNDGDQRPASSAAVELHVQKPT